MKEYLDSLPQEEKAALERVCAVVAAEAPGAEPGTSYGVPAFRLPGTSAARGSRRRRST